MSVAYDDQCVFCRIIAGKIPSSPVYQDERFICIRDLHPQAKTHLLVIPRQHVVSLDTAFPQSGAGQVELIGGLFEVATHVARQQGLLGGFRSVINTGPDGGQTVQHLHLHILGGEELRGSFG